MDARWKEKDGKQKKKHESKEKKRKKTAKGRRSEEEEGEEGQGGGGGLTGDEVAAHEGLGELLGEAVLGVPEGPALLVEVLPEVGQGHRQRVLVGVLALELVQDEGAAGGGHRGHAQGRSAPPGTRGDSVQPPAPVSRSSCCDDDAPRSGVTPSPPPR